MTETRAQLYTSSWQAPYHSFRRKRQNSFILLPLLSPKSFATLRGPHEALCALPRAELSTQPCRVPSLAALSIRKYCSRHTPRPLSLTAAPCGTAWSFPKNPITPSLRGRWRSPCPWSCPERNRPALEGWN